MLIFTSVVIVVVTQINIILYHKRLRLSLDMNKNVMEHVKMFLYHSYFWSNVCFIFRTAQKNNDWLKNESLILKIKIRGVTSWFSSLSFPNFCVSTKIISKLFEIQKVYKNAKLFMDLFVLKGKFCFERRRKKLCQY